MTALISIKDQLIDHLWFPNVNEFAQKEYPRRQRNKKLSLLTLTNDKNYKEITKLEEGNIIKRDNTVAWNNSRIVGWRLDTLLGRATIVGETSFEICSRNNFEPICDNFPFDILNIDFSSQDIEFLSGRIEQEINCLEKIIKLQREQSSDKYVLIYTTILNGLSVSYSSIVTTSNLIITQGWEGLEAGLFSPDLNGHDEIAECVEYLLSNLISKHTFNCIINRLLLLIPHDTQKVLSIIARVSK